MSTTAVSCDSCVVSLQSMNLTKLFHQLDAETLQNLLPEIYKIIWRCQPSYLSWLVWLIAYVVGKFCCTYSLVRGRVVLAAIAVHCCRPSVTETNIIARNAASLAKCCVSYKVLCFSVIACYRWTVSWKETLNWSICCWKVSDMSGLLMKDMTHTHACQFVFVDFVAC